MCNLDVLVHTGTAHDGPYILRDGGNAVAVAHEQVIG
jgi:hypothetical protein